MKKIFFAIIDTLSVPGTNAQQDKIPLKDVFTDAIAQTQLMLANIARESGGKNDWIVPRTLEQATLNLVHSGDWTSGFFPGQLWLLYEFTKDTVWKQKADSFTRLLAKEQYNGRTHDMGFKIYCSYGNGFRLTGDPSYKAVIIDSAKTLVTRFNKRIGSIRSWDHNKDKWQFPVIIDNMMNLELLFAATRLSGDSVFYKVAVAHANTTLRNHFRENFSSYHVVDYDTLTGKVIQENTHQGYADHSA